MKLIRTGPALVAALCVSAMMGTVAAQRRRLNSPPKSITDMEEENEPNELDNFFSDDEDSHYHYRRLEPSKLFVVDSKASSVYQGRAEFRHENAYDENLQTRWSSENWDNQWIGFKFPMVSPLRKVVLVWHESYAASYEFQVSQDGHADSWETVFKEENGKGGIETIYLPDDTYGKYIRMFGIKRATEYGFSLYEMEVWAGTFEEVPSTASIIEHPGTQEPSMEASIIEHATTQEPSMEASIIEHATTQEPSMEASIIEHATTQEPSMESALCVTHQKCALEEFYDNNIGDLLCSVENCTWKENGTFIENYCEIDEVECDRSDNVIELNRNGKDHIDGSDLLRELKYLEFLQTLDLGFEPECIYGEFDCLVDISAEWENCISSNCTDAPCAEDLDGGPKCWTEPVDAETRDCVASCTGNQTLTYVPLVLCFNLTDRSGKLAGVVPSDLWSIETLDEVDLSGNAFAEVEAIPDELFDRRAENPVDVLDLRNNNFPDGYNLPCSFCTEIFNDVYVDCDGTQPRVNCYCCNNRKCSSASISNHEAFCNITSSPDKQGGPSPDKKGGPSLVAAKKGGVKGEKKEEGDLGRAKKEGKEKGKKTEKV